MALPTLPSLPSTPRLPSYGMQNPYAPQGPQMLSEDERQSALSVLAGGALSGLGAIGGALDKATGSRALRGLVAGKPRELLSILPFSDTLGITDAKDITEGKEITGWDDPDSWWDNIANFGVEVALDPTLPFTGLLKGGLTGGGKALKKVGALQDVDDALRMVSGANKFNPRTARAGSTLGEGLEALAVDNKFRADEILGTLKEKFPDTFDDMLQKPIGSSVNFMGKPLNIPGADKIRDETINVVRNSSVGTWFGRNLHAPLKELKTATGQMFAGRATREENRLMKDLAPAVSDGSILQDEYASVVKQLKDATPGMTDEAADLAARDQGLINFDSPEGKAQIHEWLEFKDMEVPDKYKNLVGHMRAVYDRMDVERRAYGRGRSLMDKTMDFFAHRSPLLDEAGSITPDALEKADSAAKMLGRSEQMRSINGIEGGTAGVIRLFSDNNMLETVKEVIGVAPGKWNQTTKKGKKQLVQVVDMLQKQFGSTYLKNLLKEDETIRGADNYLKVFPDTLNKNGVNVPHPYAGYIDPSTIPSVESIAKTILSTPEDVLRKGFYKNPIESFADYIHYETDTIAAMRAQAGAAIWGIRAWRQASDKEKLKYGEAKLGDLFKKTDRPVDGGGKAAGTRMNKPHFQVDAEEHLARTRHVNPFKDNALRQIAESLDEGMDIDISYKVNGETVTETLQMDNIADWMAEQGDRWDEIYRSMPSSDEWKQLALESGIPLDDLDGQTKFVKEVINSGMSWGKEHSELLDLQRKGKAVYKELENMAVPQKVIDDVRHWDRTLALPEALGDFQKAWSSLTTLFKAGVLTFPARYTRDFYSAQVQAMLLGHWSPRAMLDAARLVGTGKISNAKQYLSPMASHIPGLDAKKVASMSDEEATQVLRNYLGSMDFTGSSHSSWSEALQEGGIQKAADPNRSFVKEAYARRPGEIPLTPKSVKDKILPDMKKPASWNPLGAQGIGGRTQTTFAPYRIGEAAGNFTDGAGRTTMFLNMIKKGYAPDEIIRTIKSSQVDYSLKNMTSMERHLFSQLFPFWRFSKNMFPFVFENILNQPAGPMAQAIRRASGSPGVNQEFTPEHIRQGMAMPLTGPLGSRDPNRQRYLTGLGLMHEDVAQTYNPGQSTYDTVRGTVGNIIGKMNPMIKVPFELASGTQIYSQRRLKDLDSGVGRMISNIGKSTGIPGIPTEPPRPPILVDELLANSPLARVISTTRTAFDPGKGMVARGVNVLTGGRLSDVDMVKARRIAIREEIENRLRGRPGISTMRPNLYRDKRYAGQLSYADQLLLDLYRSQRASAQPSR